MERTVKGGRTPLSTEHAEAFTPEDWARVEKLTGTYDWALMQRAFSRWSRDSDGSVSGTFELVRLSVDNPGTENEELFFRPRGSRSGRYDAVDYESDGTLYGEEHGTGSETFDVDSDAMSLRIWPRKGLYGFESRNFRIPTIWTHTSGSSHDSAVYLGAMYRGGGDPDYYKPLPSSPTLQGSGAYGELDDQGRVNFTFSLTASGKTTITAKPVASQPALVRGELVQLDGSQSTGPITSYEWTFSPSASGGCPDGVEPHSDAKKTGLKISVMALCSFTATLTVRDSEKNEHSASVEVTVTPRPNWKTSFTQRKQVRQWERRPLLYDFENAKAFGINVCTHDGVNDPDNPQQDSLHIIHKRGGWADPFKKTSWEGEGYEVGQVNDPGGPFHEMWFVTKNKLHIDRTALVNADLVDANGKLDRNGKIYQTNKKRGFKDVKAIVDSTIDHEHLHGTMIREALDKLKKEGEDPAKKIEGMFDTEYEALLKKVNAPIQEAELVLWHAATNHPELCPRLKKWHRPGEILLPTKADRDKYKLYDIPDLACKGGDSQFTTP